MSVERGARIFRRRCSTCHTIGEGEEHGTGPNLFDIVNNKAGRHRLFHYSLNNRIKNIIWDYKTLDQFLKLPKSIIPGTIMISKPMKNEQDRKDVIVFMDQYHPIYKLQTNKQNSSNFLNKSFASIDEMNLYDAKAPTQSRRKKYNQPKNQDEEISLRQPNMYTHWGELAASNENQESLQSQQT